MTDLRKAADKALKQLQRDDVYLGHRSKTRADAIEALHQALAQPDEVLAEREACAKVCEDIANKHARVHYPDLEAVADECSGKIRARGDE